MAGTLKTPLLRLKKRTQFQSTILNLWNSGVGVGQRYGSQTEAYLQILLQCFVVSDPKHPENEGKVFLFRYGKKIFDKLSRGDEPTV